MIVVNDINKASSTDSDWEFLGEYSLSEFLVDMDMRDRAELGLLFQAVKALAIKPELVDIIENKLAMFASQAPGKLDQRRFDAPTFVRIFCHKDNRREEISVEPSNDTATRRAIPSTQIIDRSDPDIKGGWGYFLIERGGGFAPNSIVNTYNLIDLYLYKEGE